MTKMLTLVTWVVGGLITIAISTARNLIGFDWESPFFMYFYPTLEFAIILATVITYTYILTVNLQATQL